MTVWNPWHGCHKISAGCRHCYVYRRDESIGKNAGIVTKTQDFDLPKKKTRQKTWKLTAQDNPVYTCLTSDFFLEEGDPWRNECWKMMKERQDLQFVIITKRILRFYDCIPRDWGDGYPNVTVYCTCENQNCADERLPYFLKLPIRHKGIMHEPMLESIEIERYLADGTIELVVCGGESGEGARVCHYDWILHTREQCKIHQVSFHFKQTGACFVKDGKTYRIDRKLQESQAAKAGIDLDYKANEEFDREKWLSTDLFERISKSTFRSRFQLKETDRAYVREKGMERIRSHAEDFVRQRLSAKQPVNDGKQTPMRGHPVFLAQHACGCCCRGCLEKWHGIPQGVELDEEKQKQVVDVLMEWIRRQME